MKNDEDSLEVPSSSKSAKIIRAIMQAAGGAIPLGGGLLSAAAGVWSENEQEQVNKFITSWLKMLEDEIREKQQTLLEIVERIDLSNSQTQERISSPAYQSLIRKTFREWSGAESTEKRRYIRNILSNAASTTLTSDDVLKLFLDWINDYSELHFKVIGAIYQNKGATRSETWTALQKPAVREDSAEADLFRLLFRDLSTGGIIRQFRRTDYAGNFLKKTPKPKGSGQQVTSAFDDVEEYELTALGNQFVHYAMTELSIKIEGSSEVKT